MARSSARMRMASQFTGPSPDRHGSLNLQPSKVGAPWEQGGDKPPPLHFAIITLATRPHPHFSSLLPLPMSVASRPPPSAADRHTASGKPRHRRAAVDAST